MSQVEKNKEVHPLIAQEYEESGGFVFGLWNECPLHVPVAWGARAIANEGGSFGLVPDRQTFGGDRRLFVAFSDVLNKGPIKRAIEVCRRLRNGFYPHDMPEREFEGYVDQIMLEKREHGKRSVIPGGTARNLREISKKQHESGVENLLMHKHPEILGYQPRRMKDSECETFVLYDDRHVTILGNTNASYGYVYLIGFPACDLVDIDKVLPGNRFPGTKEAAKDSVYWSGDFPIPTPGSVVDVQHPAYGESIVLSYKVIHNWLGLITIPKKESEDFRKMRNEDLNSQGHPYSSTCFVFGNDLRKAND